jgi:sulfatase maturation enzyme AslB (radical SAM superfamily)
LCNLKCDICSIWRSLPKSNISFEQLKEVVDFSSQTACYISFSGGEPLMVPDIIRMISYASSKIPYVHLVSNGYLVSENIVIELKQANLTEVSLSLDGEAEWHNKTRGSEKSFDALINAIECFKKEAAEIKIVIDTVMYPDALGQTRKAVEISKRLGVFHKVQPVNRHFNFLNSLGQPPDLDFSNVNEKELEDLIDYLIKSPHVLNSSYFLKQIPLYFSNNLICKPSRPKCRLPYFFLEVSAYGKVSPCMYGTGWDGVLAIDSDLKKNFSSKKYKMQQKKLEQCRLCDRSMYMCYWESLIQFPLIHSIVYGLRN